jgi:hypothetical protein
MKPFVATEKPKETPTKRNNLGHAEVKIFDAQGKLKKIIPAKDGPNAGYNSKWNRPKASRDKMAGLCS